MLESAVGRLNGTGRHVAETLEALPLAVCHLHAEKRGEREPTTQTLCAHADALLTRRAMDVVHTSQIDQICMYKKP